MLKPPYTRYDQLYVYNFDRIDLGIIDDPDLIGTWIEDDTAILFFHKEKKELVEAICRRSGAEIIYDANLDYQDWEAGLDITTFSVPPLVVAPLWEVDQLNDNEEEITIQLDPSVIFGSGFHPTTRLCLQTISDMLCSTPRQINTMVDFGTGTGLLSLGAAKLGVDTIRSYDNNPFACTVAEKNVGLNNCDTQITVMEADLRGVLPDTSVDLVVANLYKGLLLSFFENPDFWNARYYIISGFIPSMEEELLAALPMDKLKLLERRKSDTWRLWVLANTMV
ncbi:ribosomal protein L11 methylase [Desulfocapsa sulfexigens DSM 10523]|uniref:Ribosomal protein L11 methylase n=1 Tax=Desulfocapsa sulfexigens (strain DSM 10523 / SB164P1) TaxID=1167006 RepID=M1PQW1_DESSD|nr:50S ribosomal protein L11 methyltransferase [Desulfocapsa sulfexigens]AGF78786.1 ribosomal protein L11 methylase [Desulfocapsa sulfexigens DSM 10523]